MTLRRVLVTGAAGFLGRQVALRLTGMGIHVVAHGRTAASVAKLEQAGVQAVGWDLTTGARTELRTIGNLDAIVHCAGLSSNWGPRAAFKAANVDGTRILIDQMRNHGVPHFLYVSSSSVYFALRDCLNVDEDRPLPAPINHYAWSKRAAEEIVLSQRDLPATVVRPRGLYGRGDVALLPRLVRAAQRGPLPLFRDGSTVIDLTHVEDVVSSIVAILEAPEATRGKVYNVSGGEHLPVRHIIESAAKRASVAVRWRPVPWAIARVALQALEGWHRAFKPTREPVATVYSAGLLAFSQTLNIERIRRDIGWRPAISFAEGLDRTFGEAV